MYPCAATKHSDGDDDYARQARPTMTVERIKMPKRGVNWANSKNVCNN